MTSVLEICTLHLKPSYAADARQHEADMKEGMRSTVLKIPGVRWARWATCVEKPNISTVFVGACGRRDLLAVRLGGLRTDMDA
jgi:hypothetical protein